MPAPLRQGFLVLAHRNPKLCARLVAHLQAIGGSVYLHIDSKVEIDEFKEALKGVPEQIVMLGRRHDIRWGGFSMIQATLDLVDVMLQDGGYDRYTLLSGDSYPIKSRSEILDALTSDKDFISCLRIPPDDPKLSRIQRVYLPDTDCGSFRPGIAGWTDRYVSEADLATLAELPALMKSRSEFVARFPYHTGSQWWSLTSLSLQRLLDFFSSNWDFANHFRFSAVPDESFFQTAYATIGPDTEQRRTGFVLADWSRQPKPFTFTGIEESARLKASPQLFARKFSDASAPLLDLIDRDIATGSPGRR